MAGLIIYKVGGLSNLVYKLNSKHVIAQMDQRNSQFSKSEKSKGCIVFLGDSITEYGEWSEMFPSYKIINRGIAADGISGILSRLDEVVRHEPKTIFLMIGINDLSFHPAADVISNYKTLINKIQLQLPYTELVVQSILPINNSVFNIGIDNRKIDKVNQALKETCQQMNISYLDLTLAFKDIENNLIEAYTEDGIHINGIAYNEWKKKLTPWFPTE